MFTYPELILAPAFSLLSTLLRALAKDFCCSGRFSQPTALALFRAASLGGDAANPRRPRSCGTRGFRPAFRNSSKKLVAKPHYSLNELGMARISLQFAPQGKDMHVHGSRRRRSTVAPNFLQKLLSG